MTLSHQDLYRKFTVICQTTSQRQTQCKSACLIFDQTQTRSDLLPLWSLLDEVTKAKLGRVLVG